MNANNIATDKSLLVHGTAVHGYSVSILELLHKLCLWWFSLLLAD